MFFTLFYMYSTFLQWWRLGTLRNKLRGTLNGTNALLVCSGNTLSDPQHHRSLETLLYHNVDKFACTVVPRQKVNLSSWAMFPKNDFNLPVQFARSKLRLHDPKMFIMITTQLEKYYPHQAEVIEIERFGDLVAWKITDFMNIIIKTDMDNVARLVHCLSNGDVDINHELKVINIETVDVESTPVRIRYNKIFPTETRLRYSVSEIAWREFVDDLKELYSKVADRTTTPNPKITIDNNGAKSKLPVSEVKPIKKEPRHATETPPDKDMLEVRNCRREQRVKAPTRSRSKEEKYRAGRNLDLQARSRNTSGYITTSKSTNRTSSSDVQAQSDDSTAEIGRKPKSKKRVATLQKMNSLHEDDDPTPLNSTVKPTENFAGTSVLSEANVKFPTQREMTRKNSSTKRSTKPPNVLVYGDSLAAKENVKNVLADILNEEKYTIYDLPVGKACEFWDASTVLVVICGNVTPSLTHELLQYLINGGQLLCLCSDLLYSVLQTFSTAEVREHELVRFSYGNWKQIKMMHHIFCYQASPAKKQFSKDSDQSNHSGGETSSPIAPRTPSAVEIVHNGQSYAVQVRVLGTEETWQTPSLLLATVRDGEGRAIFSQVHLEVDPTQYQDDESKYRALTESNEARLEILKHILSTHLDVDCRERSEEITYTPAYFLGRHDKKLQMLRENENISENKLMGDKLTLVFCWKDDQPGNASPARLPVMVLSCPSNFSTVEYFETLNTRDVGRLVIYSDVLTSSQHVLSEKLVHGLVVIARQQTGGIGRSQNVWLSPLGCAMFSLQLHVNLKSTLGKSLPLIQHLVMVAVATALRSQQGYENLEIGLKWPNDLYAYSKVKIGGLVVNTKVFKEVAIVNVGCGVNLDNADPTTCVNDMIAKHNAEFRTNLPKIPFEKYFALVFNELEKMLVIVDEGDLDHFYRLYYKFWLHSDSEIYVKTEGDQVRKVRITGIDRFGYLNVRSSDGTVSSVQPDGNSFDMLKGLIAPKVY